MDIWYIQNGFLWRNSYKIGIQYIYLLGVVMAIRSVSIRIEEEMLEKIGFVADYEGRSVNSHILVLIRENIRSFEETHGRIDGDIAPDLNVKPGRK